MNKVLWRRLAWSKANSARRRSVFECGADISLYFLLCWSLIAVCCLTARSQTSTGQFNGHVTDANGGLLPNADVELVDNQTNLTRKTKTNAEGYYQFPLISPGNYKIIVTVAGFDTASTPELRLEVNQSATQDFHMRVGATTQTVDVTSAAELLEASTANLGTVVERRAVADLPLNGRSFSGLLTLAPGVSPVNYSQNSTVSYGTSFGSPGIPGSTYSFPSTQGQWNRENLYYIDGVINTASFAGSYDVPPIIDSIQEFKIQSHNDQTEFGTVLGGVVNLVTKSGTNNYHGSVWEYLRNNVFDSRNPFTDFKDNKPASPASFRQNEFGGTIGGPVWIPKLYNGKNKTFFFAAYEGWRYAKAVGATYTSPTAAELDGDFTNSSVRLKDSNGNYFVPLLYDPFSTTGTPGNYKRALLGGDGLHIPKSMIDPTAQAFLKANSDAPNFTPTTPGGNNTILNALGTNNANAATARVDQNFGSKNTLWFRYSFLNGTNGTPKSAHLNTLSRADNRNFGGGYTHVFSPTQILDATIGYSGRFNAVSESVPINVPDSDIYASIKPVYGRVNFGFGPQYNAMGGSGPSGSESHELNFAVNLTWIHGNHQFRYGFEEIIPEMSQGHSGGNFGGALFTFASQETANPQPGLSSSTGNPMASALIGTPNSGRFTRQVNQIRTVIPAAYIQDSWKTTPKLTLNFGLRWDGQSSPHLLGGTTAAMLDPNTGNWIVSGGKMPPPCNPGGGVYAPCIPSSDPATNAILAAHVKVADNPNLGPDPIYTNIGPRFGFAYKVDEKTVIRGGYGMIYSTLTGTTQTIRDRLFGWPSNASLLPNYNSFGPGSQIQTMAAIVPTLSNTQALPSVPTPFNQFGWYYDPHLKNPYSHQFNLEIQRQVTSSLAATISYVGSVNNKLPITGLSNNSPRPGGAGLDRPFPWAGTAYEATSRGTANYNALQMRADKRFDNGFGFGTGLTWSKTLDNGGTGFFGVENGPQGWATMQNYNDLDANYGISANSLKFIYYGWLLYELPFGKDKPYLNHGVGSAVLGNWQTNIILSARSGVPLGFVDAGSDPANIGNQGGTLYSRPNLTGNPRKSHPTKSEAFNTSVFAHPVNQYGNSGRGNITGMPYDNVDFSLMKAMYFGERFNMQFRAEFFNVFNIQNYGIPGVTFGGSNFGVITSLAPGANPRQIQFSLRGHF